MEYQDLQEDRWATLEVVVANALYSALELILEIVCCFFFYFQNIRAFPRYMEKPVTDFLVSWQVAQSDSL